MSDVSSQFSDRILPPQDAAAAVPDIAAPLPHRLRLWPGIVIIALQWIAVTAIGELFPGTPMQFYAMFMGPLAGAILVLAWWLFFSRLWWLDRLLIPVICAASVGWVLLIGHETIGLFGIFLYGLPAVLTAWVGWLAVSFLLPWPIRRAGLIFVLLVTWSYFTLIRMDGVWGGMSATINWRWTPTTEQLFLADRAAAELAAPSRDAKARPLVLGAGDWPGFRGPERDNRITGVTIPTDWDANPPKLLWKRKVGPGWGSFAVIGSRLFTQEQWDQSEAIVCYDADCGKILWSHETPARFSEIVAGPGPRATPTFHDGKLYVMGAAGNLACLDAATGTVLWSQNIVEDSGATVPQWGYAASPLVIQGMVMVFAGGEKKAALAYDADTGKLAWAAGDGKLSYSSLQRAVIDGVEQALLASGDGLTSFTPKDGRILWNHAWPIDGAARCVQPASLPNNDFLLGAPFGSGSRRIHVAKTSDGWQTSELWHSKDISPYFNDLVIHKNHAYGFNGEIFMCVNLDKGKTKWKERGYGCGQVLLLVDQDLLLVTSEKGEAVLLEANPSELRELGRFQAIKGKTWNHPVLAHGRLYVRNGEEAACYQLAPGKN